jgi:hypothetical protein
VYLSFTNYIDDGLLVYLNGVELFSFNMVPDRPVLWSVNALPGGANPGGEPVIFRTNLVPSNLIVGDNVLAVELHQQAAGSSDDVFGMWMATLIPYAPTNLALNQPTNRVLLQNRTTTLICVADGFPPQHSNGIWTALPSPMRPARH